jgi:predicted enzyme related to lactoylglutathione lyase
MGQPVVHFEVVGKDGEKLQIYYAELFDWDVNAENEMKYGLVDREANSNAEGIGLGGGIGQGPEGYGGHVTFYVEVPSVEEALSKAESLGGSRVMGPRDDHGPHGPRPVHRPRGQRDRVDRGREPVEVSLSVDLDPAGATRPNNTGPISEAG